MKLKGLLIGLLLAWTLVCTASASAQGREGSTPDGHGKRPPVSYAISSNAYWTPVSV